MPDEPENDDGREWDDLLNQLHDEEREIYSGEFGDPPSLAALNSLPNYAYWARAAYWTVDDITALSMGRNPQVFNEDACYPKSALYALCNQFMDLRELVSRAVEMGQLYQRTIPNFALAWLRRMQIDYPPELDSEMQALGFQVADWKTRHDELAEQTQALEVALQEATSEHYRTQQEQIEQVEQFRAWAADAQRLIQHQEDQLSVAEEHVDELQNRIEVLKAGANTLDPEAVSTRERSSLLKLIIAMATDGYGYKPSDAKSPIPRELAEIVRSKQMEISDDTVRKYLKEARDTVLPRETE
tara:strand:+ start:1418 stop:2317 length:900 start_codon:yes stop_codon:yes gene_type:complete